MNKRFPVLSVISYICRAVGWIFLALGAALLVVFTLEMLGKTHLSGSSLDHGAEVVGSLLLIFFGLVTVIIGEAVGVLFAIELNTRGTENQIKLLPSRSTSPNA